MPPRPRRLALVAALAAAGLPAQITTQARALPAVADTFASVQRTFLLDLPGIADDFVLFADGAFDVRANGTARLSAYVHRQSAIDRDFHLVLELAGRVAPGSPGYPPAGSPVLALAPGAYVPQGPVDPTTFVYWTSVTGTLTGLRAYAGARLAVSNAGAAQTGVGASNQNVGNGLAVDLTVTVLQQPFAGPLLPTGPGRLRADLRPSHEQCLAHVDGDAAASGNTARTAVRWPGVATDYVWSPAAELLFAANGTATLIGQLRRQSDYSDSWQVQLVWSQRVLPGDPAHPPAGSPSLQLLPAMYAANGGPIDPAQWHYWLAASGTMTGTGINAGGSVQLAANGASQLGLGAGQGNRFFGLAGSCTATIVAQPTGRTLAPTGPVQLNANLAIGCLLPQPVITAQSVTVLPSVTEQKVVFTGTDLGFCELAAIGPHILGMDPRRFYDGNLRIVDHGTAELSIRQGMLPATYPVSLLNPARTSNQVSLDVQANTTITLRTENDRLPGETQHWVVHQGPVQGFAFSFLVLSNSNLPSVFPGIVNLSIGNQFTDVLIFGSALHDPPTGVALFVLPSVPATLSGVRLHAQAAVMDAALFPMQPSDVWFTDY